MAEKKDDPKSTQGATTQPDPSQPPAPGPAQPNQGTQRGAEQGGGSQGSTSTLRQTEQNKSGGQIIEKTTVETVRRREALPTKSYRLRAGFTHRHDGRSVSPGETVPLTERQAFSFRDKFEPVEQGGKMQSQQKPADGVEKSTSPTSKPATPPAPEPRPRPTSRIAEDIGAKTPLGSQVPNATTDPAIQQRAVDKGR